MIRLMSFGDEKYKAQAGDTCGSQPVRLRAQRVARYRGFSDRSIRHSSSKEMS